MHPNKYFRRATDAQNLEFVAAQSFGTLAINAQSGPLLSHVPFLLNVQGTEMELHLVRSNPILKHLDEEPDAVMSVVGPHAYISPDWYGIEDQVPTWNYVAVHLCGKLRREPDTELDGVLNRLSAHMEDTLLPKEPWTMDKMTDEPREKMKRMIVPVKMQVAEINSTWKLGQNKTEEVRNAAAQGLDDTNDASNAEMASLMRNPPA